MTDRQPGIVSAWRCVFPLSRVRTSGARLVQRGVVGMTQFSQVVAGWTPLNTEDLVGFAQRPGMDSAALDGLGHAVSDSVCTPCRPGGSGNPRIHGKPEELSSVMRCGERPSSRWGWHTTLAGHG